MKVETNIHGPFRTGRGRAGGMSVTCPWRVLAADGFRCYLPQHHQLLLLLGIPWLYSVHAMIDIREESLYIGDPSRGETRTELAVPTMAKTAKVPPAPWCETESDSDGSGSDLESTTSEDDTSEEEN